MSQSAAQRGDYLTELREKITQIRAINPRAEIPAGESVQSLNVVRDLLYDLQHPAPAPITQAGRAWIDINKLQNEVAVRLADHVRRGVVTYDDFKFPSERLPIPERIGELNGMNARLQRAWELHHMSPENRAKLAMIEIETLKGEVRETRTMLKDALLRLGAIEQELSHT